MKNNREKVKVKDTYNDVCDWSDQLLVELMKSGGLDGEVDLYDLATLLGY